MIDTLLGTKSHMSQIFTVDGRRFAVTVVKTGANIVSQVKTEDKDGYGALQLAWGTRNLRTLKKPQVGHLKKVTTDKKVTFKFLKEVARVDDQEYKVGDAIKPSEVLEVGDLVAVTGVSKGKGFQGVVRRWGFAGGPRTHGQSDRLRAPGSIGQGTTPGRVWKGKKMAGRMGNDQQTIKNLMVLKVDEETGELYLSGPVPGVTGSLLVITKIGKNPKEFLLAGTKREEDGQLEVAESAIVIDENVVDSLNELQEEEPKIEEQEEENGSQS